MNPVHAVEHIRRLPGGSQPQLMRASDDKYYVVKFQSNPQGTRVLANEMLGSLSARLLGLPVPEVAAIDVCDDLIRFGKGITIQTENGWRFCQAGLCCASLFQPQSYGLRPELIASLEAFENIGDTLGALVFDKWASNTDRRQWIARRSTRASAYRLTMVDQADCFCRDKWNFSNGSIIGLCEDRRLYRHISSVEDFEPWLSRLEGEVSRADLRNLADNIPPEWYRSDVEALNGLVEQLDSRRALTRALLESTIRHRPDYFPRAKSLLTPLRPPRHDPTVSAITAS